MASLKRRLRQARGAQDDRLDELRYALDGLGTRALQLESVGELARLWEAPALRVAGLALKAGTLPATACAALTRLLAPGNRLAPHAALVLAKLFTVDEEVLELVQDPAAVARLAPQTACLEALVNLLVAEDRAEAPRLSAADAKAHRLLEGLEEGACDAVRDRLPVLRSRGVTVREAALVALAAMARVHTTCLKRQSGVEDALRPLLCKLGTALESAVTSASRAIAASSGAGVAAWPALATAYVAELYSSVTRLSGLFFAESGGKRRARPGTLLPSLLEATEACLGSDLGAQAGVPEWRQELALGALRVAANLTHENPAGIESMRGQGLHVAFELFQALTRARQGGTVRSEHARAVLFDTSLIVQGLLINCVETDAANREVLGQGCAQIVDFFVSFIPKAVVAQLAKGSAKAELEFGWSGEDLVAGAYSCLLMGCLMRGSKANMERIERALPGHSVVILMQVLQAYLAFQEDAEVLSKQTMHKTLEIMKEMRESVLASNKGRQDITGLPTIAELPVPEEDEEDEDAEPAPAPAPARPARKIAAATGATAQKPGRATRTRGASGRSASISSSSSCSQSSQDSSQSAATSRSSARGRATNKRRCIPSPKARDKRPKAVLDLDDVF